MEEFSFTPDSIQTPQNNDNAEFSFTPDKTQPDFTKVGAQDIFSEDGSNTNAAQKMRLVNKSWVDRFTQSDLGKFGDSQSKAVVRGMFEIGGGLGTMIRFYGDNMILPKGSFGWSDKTIDRINSFGRGWQRFGESIKKGADFVLNSKTLELDKDIFAGNIIDNPSVTRISAAIMSAVPSLLSMKSLVDVTGSTGLAYFIMGGVDSASVYEKAKEKGKTQEEANLLYTSSQAGTALIDKMFSPLEKIMGSSPNTVWKKISQKITSGLSEGSAEGMQTFWQNTVTKYGIDDTQALMDGVIEAAIGGFGAGALAAGSFNTAAERLKEKGATERDIENIAKAATAYIQQHPDEINDIAFQQLNKGLDEFDKFVEAHKETPEAQKALQTKQELEQIYTDVSGHLKKAGVAEDVANADAKIWQGIALWGSQELGVSPAEYMKRMPKIESMTYEQFQNRGKTLEEELNDYIPYQLPAEAYNKQGKADVNSEAFKRWSDNSPVVSAQQAKNYSFETGKAITVEAFHGTKTKGIEVFEYDKNRQTGTDYGEAYYSTTDYDKASGYAYDQLKDKRVIEIDNRRNALKKEITEIMLKEGKNEKTDQLMAEFSELSDRKYNIVQAGTAEDSNGAIMPIYMNFRNPLVVDADNKFYFQVYNEYFQKARSKGHDGIIVKNVIDNPRGEQRAIDVFIVFSPNQIKSVYNRGTFDPSNDNIYYQGKIAENGRNVELTINSQEEMQGLSDEDFKNKMLDTLKSFKGNKIFNQSLNGDIEIRTSSIKKYKSFFADKNKRLIVPYIPELLAKAKFISENTYTPETEKNIVAYWKADLPINIDSDGYNVHLTVKEDDKGNFFWDAQIKGKARRTVSATNPSVGGLQSPSAYPATNPGGKGLPSELSEDGLSVTQTSKNVNNPLYQSAFAGSRVDYDRPSLEAIGSGEGNQAHGWGLYYALNKDVAERYRKSFTNNNLKEQYQGKEVVDWYNEDAITFAALRKIIDNNMDKEEALRNQELIIDKSSDTSAVYYDEDILAEQKAILQRIEEINVDDIVIEKPKGQVHEVDIPESPYLLDEDTAVWQQSDIVKDGISNLVDKLSDEQVGQLQVGQYDVAEKREILKSNLQSETGRKLYKTLTNVLGSKQAASEMLKSVGIKGITYDGNQDGRCFVIFNPADVKVIQKFYQDASKPKGAYMQNLDRNGIIYLFEKADASTFMHETAHFFFKELQSFDTARSREMLKKVNEWENNQFDQRYKIQEQGGGFVVTDKIGNVIYGAEKPFFDAETAREYGKNEIFARGFEQYLREGKAPSNYLKQAFRSFWNWLRHLYKAALDLNVELNDGIRSVYGDIIGGQDLDFYLSAPVDEVLQQHFAENEDRKKIYEEQIALAQAQPIKRNFTANLVRERTDGAKGRNEWWNKAMVPISTRAKRVNIKLRNKLRAYDYGLNTKLNQYYAQIKPFLDKWATMTETDAVAFDLALKNSYVEKQIEIVKKYDAYDEFVAVKNLLNSLFDQAIDVGIEMGYSSDYFPRQIEDVEGFMAAMYGSPFSSQLRRALREADPDNVMTNEERAEFFNKYLRGFNRRDLNKPLPGNTKDRSIDIVTAEMNKYYKPSMQALISYIEGMNTSIESRKFWGFKSDDINQSIGALTADLVDTGVITPEQDAEVQEILRARFKAKGVTNKWLNLQKNVSYIYTMGGLNSAITQLDDISMSLYKAGLWNTVQSVLHPNRPGLSREELGLERIGQEFVEASTSSQAVSTIFKLTGLDKIDAFGKNTLINATFNKFQKMAKNNEAELRARIEPVMEQETEQTIEDIKNGVISQNVKLLMFNELADVQPIALSEMPEWYLTSGNGRVFYMLKTFMLKRLDIFRNESFDRMRQGDVKTGMRNLFRLAILMILSGAAKDAIIDMMFGRDFDVTDTMVNNLLGLAGISKYTLYKARDEGFSGFASSFLIPPVFASSSDLLSDIYKSLFSKKGKDIKDYEIWKGVPLIGRFYYWWMGGGRTKENRKKKKKLK